VIVVQHGGIVAERYAPGFDARTRLLGWSMSKSVNNAPIGALVADGKLQLNAPVPLSSCARRETDTPGHAQAIAHHVYRPAFCWRKLVTKTVGLPIASAQPLPLSSV